MLFQVTLERGTDGGYMAWIHELPGCYARGATREEVIGKIALAIAEFTAWLRKTGEFVPDQPVEYKIVDEVEMLEPAALGSSDVLLAPDSRPLDTAAWRQLERWLRRSRRDLLRTLRQIPEDAMDGEPEDTSRSTREHLQHVAFVEFMYMAWTFDLASKTGLTDFLRWTRKLAIARMRELAQTDQGAVTQARWSGAPRLESWTARKAARRLIWHERLHSRAIDRLWRRIRRDGLRD